MRTANTYHTLGGILLLPTLDWTISIPGFLTEDPQDIPTYFAKKLKRPF